MISGGLIMFTYESTQFKILGFILCLLGSFTSGIRWTLAQLIMQKSKLGLKNPVDMMFYMQPWMLVSIFPVAVFIEGSRMLDSFASIDWNDRRLIFITMTTVFSGAILAFCMEVLEFLVVTYGSSLTLSISGIFKVKLLFILFYLFIYAFFETNLFLAGFLVKSDPLRVVFFY